MTVTFPRQKRFERRPRSRTDADAVRTDWNAALTAGQSAIVARWIVEPHRLTTREDVALVRELFDLMCHEGSPSDQKAVRERIFRGRPLPIFETLTQLELGRTIYPFRQPIAAAYMRELNVLSAFPISLLGMQGRGESFSDALQDLARNVHIVFQELESCIPSEMSEDCQKRWSLLSSWVNVERYRDLTPMQFRRLGFVLSRSPFRIQWLDDDSATDIDLAEAPSQMARFAEGIWLEAMVEFDRQRRQITRVLSVETIEPLVGNGPSESQAGPTLGIGDLPSENWDSF